ncbi:MAG TPA: hypothetical protein VG866_00400 [Candidatus Paceibacterota bacterium]|nr:hypothetical protein [Candidatus Paceibacterota bacterium]
MHLTITDDPKARKRIFNEARQISGLKFAFEGFDSNKSLEELDLDFDKSIQALYSWLGDNSHTVQEICHLITQYANPTWSHSEIGIVVLPTAWAFCLHNVITLGIRPPELVSSPDFNLIIHELLHMNLNEKRKELQAAEEITVTLLTRKIAEEANKKLNLHLFLQEFSQSVAKAAHRIEDQFPKILETVSTPAHIVSTIDSLLEQSEREPGGSF